MRIYLLGLLIACLLGGAALADTTLRYVPLERTPGDLASDSEVSADDRYVGDWDGGCDDSGYDGGYDDGWGYPIMPTPRVIAPPVVVPPFIGHPVPRLPERIRRLRDGTWVREPDPHFQYFNVPGYPNIATAGSAYFPTPDYPYYGRTRVDVHVYRQERYTYQ